MDKALKKMMKSLPKKEWQARIADVTQGGAIINGGENVRLKTGTTFIAYGPGRDVADPVTGNVIHRLPGQAMGRVVVTQVFEQSAYAQIIEGSVKRGALLKNASRERSR